MKMEIMSGVQLVAYVMCLISLNLDTTNALPLDHVSPDAPSQQITSTFTDIKMPPLVFPKDTQKYKIQPINETALKILQHSASVQGNNTNNQTVPVVTASLKMEEKSLQGVLAATSTIPPPFDLNIINDPKQDAENIQSNGLQSPNAELEEQFELKSQNLQQSPSEFLDMTEVDQVNMKPIHHAMLLAVLLGLVCVCLYAGIVTWRYYVGQKYGNRERLVNEEDDYIPTSQPRQFEL